MKNDVLKLMGEIKDCGETLLGMLRGGNNTAEEIQGRVAAFSQVISTLKNLVQESIYAQFDEFYSSFCDFCTQCSDINFLITNVENLDESLELFVECMSLLINEYDKSIKVCPACGIETVHKILPQGYSCPKCGAVEGKVECEYAHDEDLCQNGPLVSVVMSAYNHGEFVAEAIESVINQTYKNIEFIVADDFSTDNTAEIMKRYSKHFAKAFYYDYNAGGRFTTLIAQTTGKYVATMNSDDIWDLQKIEMQVAYMEEHPECGACFTWCDYVTEELDILPDKIFYQKNRSSVEWMKYFWNNGNALCTPSALLKRELRIRKPRYGAACWQLPDFFWWIDLIQSCDFYVMPKVLIKMRRYTKKKVSNVSMISEETKIRGGVEEGATWIHVIRDMEKEFFQKVFADVMINPNADSDVEIKCEKYFALLNNKNPFIQSSAFTYLYDNFNEIQTCLRENYQYTHIQVKKDIVNRGVAQYFLQ